MKFPADLYEMLTAEQRARTFVEAVARRDEAELDRLNDSCPRYRYEAEDADYIRMRLGYCLVALLAHQEASYHAQAAGAAMVALMAIDGEKADALAETVRRALRRFREVYAALEGFCEHVGISPDVLRQAYFDWPNPMMEIVEAAFGDDPESQPDDVAVSDYRELLIKVFGT